MTFGSSPTPLGLSQYQVPTQSNQGAGRPRRCLLKGCEHLFCPQRPQSRYCSAACREQAQQWRSWQSSRRYRSTPQGQERRRDQCRRYRERQRIARQIQWESDLAAVEEHVARAMAWTTNSAEVRLDKPAEVQLEPGGPCEGQRPATNQEDFSGQPCQRPGCYVLFPIRPCSAPQRFCCCRCRWALRRVLDRESRWRWRRRRHQQPRRRPRSPPGQRRLC
jgi:hypothetical protein